MSKNILIHDPSISSKIYLIRGKRVMFDSDLAELYGVLTKNLNKAVQRNLERFPEDFRFQIAVDEAESLRFQFGTSKKGRGGRRYLPYAFTEQGVSMLSSVLNSERAIRVNILIMRTFAKIKQMLTKNELLKDKIEELERKYEKHDKKFKVIFETLREFLETPNLPKKTHRISCEISMILA